MKCSLLANSCQSPVTKREMQLMLNTVSHTANQNNPLSNTRAGKGLTESRHAVKATSRHFGVPRYRHHATEVRFLPRTKHQPKGTGEPTVWLQPPLCLFGLFMKRKLYVSFTSPGTCIISNLLHYLTFPMGYLHSGFGPISWE